MKRIPWDIYEAALLVEAYWLIEDYPTQKKKILQGLSNLLRRRAIRKGMEIEPKFRNLAGMNFQYSLLQYYITDGEEGLSSHVAQTIAEVSDIYQNQHDKYLEILNHAFQETGNIDSRRGDDMGKFSQLKQRILSFFLYAPDTTLTTEKIGG